MQRGNATHSGSHSWEREGLGFTCTEFGSRSHLPNLPNPLISPLAQGAPSLTPHYSSSSRLPTPATLNPVAFHSGLEAGFRLSSWSQMDGLPQPGLASKFLHSGPKHNTISQPWLLFRKEKKKTHEGVWRKI